MSLEAEANYRWHCDMGPDTEIWPVVLVAAKIVIFIMAMAASSAGTFECIGDCG